MNVNQSLPRLLELCTKESFPYRFEAHRVCSHIHSSPWQRKRNEWRGRPARLVGGKFEIVPGTNELLGIDRLSAREIHVYVNGDKIIKINESIFVSVTPRGHDERVLIKTESLDGADSRFLDLITYHKLGRSFLIKLLATFMVKLSGPMELIASSFMASS